MIELAPDTSQEAQIKRLLKVSWFVLAATALPLTDFLRSGSSLSFISGLLGLGFIAVLISTQLYILRIGPQLLSYKERFHELHIQTALKTYRLPIERLRSLRLIEGGQLRYRTGVSTRGYHVGLFFLPNLGLVRVAASRIHGPGLLLEHSGGLFSWRRKHYLFISPEEAEAVRLVLEELMAEARWRVAFGQP